VNDKSMLISHFEEIEIKAALLECRSSKKLGLDGFTFSFIALLKRHWKIIKKDI